MLKTVVLFDIIVETSLFLFFYEYIYNYSKNTLFTSNMWKAMFIYNLNNKT